MSRADVFVHASAVVHDDAAIGPGTRIWDWSKVREKSVIGSGCNIGQSCYIDIGAVVGDRCKIQNGVSVYHGVIIGDDVFVGPNAVFTNDLVPRAFNTEWKISETQVGNGASIGANATIRCGIRLGDYAMVAAGAVVTKDIPAHGLVMGNPAKLVDYVTKSGKRLDWDMTGPAPVADKLVD